MKLTKSYLRRIINEELDAVLREDEVYEEHDDNWIQAVDKDIKKRGTKGRCTGDKFGSESCPEGSEEYNLAKTFKKMGRERKEKDHSGKRDY